MGPGLLFKSILSQHFSLMVFGFSQVAMDIQTAVCIIGGNEILHGFSHTYLGATALGFISFVIGRPICQWLLNLRHPDPDFSLFEWLFESKVISRKSALFGAFIGTYSHVLFDSIMHFDVRPFAPWSDTNAFLELISLEALHLFCMVSGGLGLIVLFVACIFRSPKHRED
jgi:hypothetical protein